MKQKQFTILILSILALTTACKQSLLSGNSESMTFSGLKSAEIYGLVSDSLWFASTDSLSAPIKVDPYVRNLQEAAFKMYSLRAASQMPLKSFDGSLPDSNGMVGTNRTNLIFDPGSQRMILTAGAILKNDITEIDRIWPAIDKFFSYQVDDGHIPYNGDQKAPGMVANGEMFALMGAVVGPSGLCEGLQLLENSKFRQNYLVKITDIRKKIQRMFRNMAYDTLTSNGQTRDQIYWLEILSQDATNRMAAAAKTLDACSRFLEKVDPELSATLRTSASREFNYVLSQQNLDQKSTVYGAWLEKSTLYHDLLNTIGLTNADVSYSNVGLGFLIQYLFFNYGEIPSQYTSVLQANAKFILDRVNTEGMVFVGDSSRCGSLEDGVHVKSANFFEMGLNLMTAREYLGLSYPPNLAGTLFSKYTQSTDITLFPVMNSYYGGP